MTKVELPFELREVLDETIAAHIADSHKIYGIIKIHVSPNMKSLRVEFDATRLTPADVASALARNGIPAARA